MPPLPPITDPQTPVYAKHTEQIRVEQASKLYHALHIATPITIFNAIILAYLQRDAVGVQIVSIWLAYMVGVSVLRYAMRYAFFKKDIAKLDVAPWVHWFFVGAVLSAIGWGAAAVFLMPTTPAMNEVVTIFVLAGMTAGAMSSLYFIWRIYAAFVVSALLPLIVMLFLRGGEVHIAMSAMVMFFMIFMLVFGRRYQDDFIKLLELGFAQSDMTKHMEEAKAKTEELNLELSDEIKERLLVETELLKRESLLKHHIERTPLAAITWDRNFRVMSWNPAAEKIFGYTANEALGRTALDLILPKELEQKIVHEIFQDLLKRSGGEHSINENITKAHQVITCEWYNTPLRDMQGDVVGVASLAQDITEKLKIEQSLHLAKDTAIKASQAKSEFLSSMSHELRTPLNGILGFAQLLQYNSTEPLTDTQNKNVQNILQSGEHLLKLIGEVLDLARIESGDNYLNIETINPAEIISQSVKISEALCARMNIKMIDHTAGKVLPDVRADETRLKQVLLNVLSNAIKYNIENGKIEIDFDIDGDMAVFKVSDTGHGIDAKKQAQVFEPFNRLGRESGAIEGTGVGMAITQKLVNNMRGDIGFKSEVGSGTRFWFTVPLDSPQTAEQIKQSWMVSDQSADASADSAIDAPRDEKPQLSSEISLGDKIFRILYVEDNPGNQMLLEKFLEMYGSFSLRCVSDAEQGIAVARETRPDLILMDLNLPGMSGMDALHALRGAPETKAIPVVAVTAKAMRSDIDAGLQAGFDDYVVKPYKFDKLMEVMRRFLVDA